MDLRPPVPGLSAMTIKQQEISKVESPSTIFLEGQDGTEASSRNAWLTACIDDCWTLKTSKASDKSTDKPLPELSSSELVKLKEKLNLPDHDTAFRVRNDINRFGTNPEDTLVSLMKENRVLGMGEFHEGDSQFRATGIKTIERLKEAGATHLAVEMHSDLKPLYDQFQKDGNIPEGMLTGYWNTDDFRELVTKARDSGLKVVPVDLPKPWDGRWSKRDPHMADKVGEILAQDPGNKVVLWLGGMHLADATGDKGPEGYTTASTVLKDRYPGQVATVDHVRIADRLLGLTEDIRKPIAVPNHGTAVGALKESAYIQSPGEMSHDHWDYSVIYPLKGDKR